MEETNKEQTNAQQTQEFTAQEAANRTEPVATKQPRVKWSSLKKLKVACAALAIGLALSLGGNIALVAGNLNNPADIRHDAKMEQSFAPGDRSGNAAERPGMLGAPEEDGESSNADANEKPDMSSKPDESGKSKQQNNDAGNEQGGQNQNQSSQSESKAV